MKSILISLVSDQTIPNVELIKEFGAQITEHLLVHTSQKTDQMQWIIDATKIENYKTLEVNAFDVADIEQKLKSFDFPDGQYFLNITGGTKLMILVFQEFFKNLGARIYYVTGRDCEYVKVFPALGERRFKLQASLSLEEYLTAYGFEIKAGKLMGTEEQANRILEYFLKHPLSDHLSELELIRDNRGKNLSLDGKQELSDFIDRIGFEPVTTGKLSKVETKYLSGEWFEEFVYFKIKKELGLTDSEIGTGYQLKKQGSPNELDILFIYRHQLYIVECKTSVVYYSPQPDGTMRHVKFLPEVIYKSDALRSKFGLFANTSIFTLEEIKNENGTPIKGYETHFQRAELSRINILSKRDFQSGNQLTELLKIKR